MTRASLTVPAPWRELSQTVGGPQLLAGGSHAICLWSLNLAAPPGTSVLQKWELPVPGVYRHFVHPAPFVLSRIARTTGGYEAGVSSLLAPYQTLVADPVGLVIDLDHSGVTDTVARWLGSNPLFIDLLPAGQLSGAAGSGTTLDLSAELTGLFPAGVEVSQLCLYREQLGVLAQAPGAPEDQALLLIDISLRRPVVVQTGLASAEIAVNHDTVVWSTDRSQVPGRPRRAGNSSYLLWYAGPYSAAPDLLFDVQQKGMEYRSPLLLDDILVFTQAWPPAPAQTRALRKTAVHAYPLADVRQRNPVCTELSDASLWSEDTAVTSLSRLATGQGLVCFPSRPYPGAPPIPHTRVAVIDY